MTRDSIHHTSHHAEDPSASDRREQIRSDPQRAAHHDAVFTFARASEMHDEDTGAHVLRMRGVVKAVAICLGYGEDDADDLGFDAMLHDVGKLRIPAEILAKPGVLTRAERLIMESHTIRGERMLSDRTSMKRAARIARSHHEDWNGRGYPDGLAGNDIPLEARITAVADVLDALVSPRPYKQAWPFDRAIEEVFSLRGEKFDPAVIDALSHCRAMGELHAAYGVKRNPAVSTT
jgi:putative two-component system response regulator